MGPNGHVAGQIHDYLLGALSARGEHEVEAHMLRCARCREEAVAMSEMAVALAMLPPGLVADLASAPDRPHDGSEPHET